MVQHGDHLIDKGIAIVHHIHSKFGEGSQYLLQNQGVGNTCPIVGFPVVHDARQTATQVSPYWDVVLLRNNIVGEHTWVIRRNIGVLVGNFAQYINLPMPQSLSTNAVSREVTNML